MSKIPRLENWYISGDQYSAPEIRSIYISGEVYGHPFSSLNDGQRIVTSRVTGAEGRIVTTLSMDYYLGEPSEGYREWLRKNRPDWDCENPIMVVDA